MERNFFNKKIADAVSGSATFSSLISAGASTYGLTSGQATSFAALDSALQAAQLLTLDVSTRTKVTIENRDTALVNMRNNAKLLARIIYATPTVTDGQLTALGLLPRPTRAPIPFPDTTPTVEVDAVIGRLVKLRIRNPESESRRGLPRGLKGVNIYTYVGAEVPTDPLEFQYQGLSSRSLTEILFPLSVPSGATVWVTACWVGSRGELGIGSPAISFAIQGGNIGVGKMAA